jgi:tetratricopeptide (TPR) repeat protein
VHPLLITALPTPQAWYREGRAAEGLKRYEDAAGAYYQAAQLQPENDDFIRLTKEMIVEGRKEFQAQQAQQAAATGSAPSAASPGPTAEA